MHIHTVYRISFLRFKLALPLPSFCHFTSRFSNFRTKTVKYQIRKETIEFLHWRNKRSTTTRKFISHKTNMKKVRKKCIHTHTRAQPLRSHKESFSLSFCLSFKYWEREVGCYSISISISVNRMKFTKPNISTWTLLCVGSHLK